MSGQINLILDRVSPSESPLLPLIAGSEQCRSGHRFGPYIREYFLLHFCLSGKGTFEIGGKTYPVTGGEIFIIPPEVVTTYEADAKDPWHYVWVGFTGGCSERLRELPPVVSYEADTFRRMLSVSEERVSNPEIYASYIHEIFYTLFGEKKRPTDVCRRVRDEIHLNYMKPITVETLSHDAGLDRRYLSRIFKERYGVALKEYLIGVRMRRAGELLLKGYSVSESAYMVGYADAFNFSKMFRKTVGCSPSEYRKKRENR